MIALPTRDYEITWFYSCSPPGETTTPAISRSRQPPIPRHSPSRLTAPEN